MFADWAVQTFRLYAGQAFIEVEYTVGPVPIEDGLGKEIISRWETGMLIVYSHREVGEGEGRRSSVDGRLVC